MRCMLATSLRTVLHVVAFEIRRIRRLTIEDSASKHQLHNSGE